MAPTSRSPAAIFFVGILVLAPLLAGGWRLEVLPLLVGLAGAGWLVLLFQRWQSGRGLVVPLFALVLGLLAGFTAFQAVPLGSILGVLSPRAAEVREFVAPDDRMTITYEVGATWREAAKLLVYGLVVALGHELARRRGARFVLLSVVSIGGLSVLAAWVHRIGQIEKLWGVFEGARAAQTLGTTFQNPNHASAFLCLTAVTAVGLGVDAKRRQERVALLAVAAILSAASMVEVSKGGVLSLAVGLSLFGFLLWKRTQKASEAIGIPVLFAALLLPLVAVVWRLDAIMREFGLGDDPVTLGLVEKLAAVQNAWPIAVDHPIAGIGRGAYISVYPHYQTSPLQLTFAFPENIAAQFVCEWGFIVGGLALLGFIWAVAVRLRHARVATEIGAMSAVAAVLVHDLVDFSLEMPGVAVPCAAIIGALTPRRQIRREGDQKIRFRRPRDAFARPAQLELRNGPLAAALALAPTILAVLFTYGAFRGGDLAADLQWLSQHGKMVASGGSPDLDEVRERSERHPANVLVSTQVAYIYEMRSPRDLNSALRAINRALYLGPRYADAHIVAGRLLARTGHRRQALEELRSAWRLTNGRRDILAAANAWSADVEELLLSVPRTDPVKGELDIFQVTHLVNFLVGTGRQPRAREVLARVPSVDRIPPDALEVLAAAALRAGLPELAMAAARRGFDLMPHESKLALTLARLARRAGRLDEARTIARSLVPTPENRKEIYEFRLQLALSAQDHEEAREVIAALRRALPVTRENQAGLAIHEARVHLAEGRPDRAVPELGRAIHWAPADVEIRLLRAKALQTLGRGAEARVDVEFVLRRRPEHPGAKRLLRALSVSN